MSVQESMQTRCSSHRPGDAKSNVLLIPEGSTCDSDSEMLMQETAEPYTHNDKAGRVLTGQEIAKRATTRWSEAVITSSCHMLQVSQHALKNMLSPMGELPLRSETQQQTHGFGRCDFEPAGDSSKTQL